MEDPLIPRLHRDLLDPGRLGRASFFQERIEQQVKKALSTLAPDEALSVVLVLPDGERIDATWFGYHDPNMLIVDGTNRANNHVRILLPHTSACLVLTWEKKAQKDGTRPIGFESRGEAEPSP